MLSYNLKQVMLTRGLIVLIIFWCRRDFRDILRRGCWTSVVNRFLRNMWTSFVRLCFVRRKICLFGNSRDKIINSFKKNNKENLVLHYDEYLELLE